MSFEQRLEDQAARALDVTEKVLNGDDLPGPQVRTALAMISGQLKSESVQNGRMRNIISFVRLGVSDVQIRERIALKALEHVLPEGTIVASSASGKVAKQPKKRHLSQPAAHDQ